MKSHKSYLPEAPEGGDFSLPEVPEGGDHSLPEAPEGGDHSPEEFPLSWQFLVAYATLEGGLSLITFWDSLASYDFMNKECFNLEETAIAQKGEGKKMKLTTNHH